jgi:hypothetical protein
MTHSSLSYAHTHTHTHIHTHTHTPSCSRSRGHRTADTALASAVSCRARSAAYVSKRQHTSSPSAASAYASIRQLTLLDLHLLCHRGPDLQHTSAYVSIRQHTPADTTGTASAVPSRARSAASVSIRQHTILRQHTPAYDSWHRT